MDRDQLLARISIDPKVCFGKPCIRGHRIWVSLILDLLAGGMSVGDVLREYPQVEEARCGEAPTKDPLSKTSYRGWRRSFGGWRVKSRRASRSPAFLGVAKAATRRPLK